MESKFHSCILNKMYFYEKIKQQLQNFILQKRILNFQTKIEYEICFDLPNAFWKKEQHVVDLSYDDSFNEKQIFTKARPI